MDDTRVKTGKKLITAIMVFLSAMLPAFGFADDAQPPRRIIIHPFAIHADTDLSFLQKGVAEIISSILAEQDDIRTLRFETQTGALQDNSELQADYRLEGAITMFGDRVSTAAKLINLETGALTLSFHELGHERGDALRHAELLAQRIKERLGGVNVVSPTADGKDNMLPEASSPKTSERVTPAASENPGQFPPMILTSNPITARIISIAAADIDGDRQNEIICASNDRLYIYRYAQSQLVLVTEKYFGRFQTIIGVDAADVNGDGKAEIFITARNSQGHVSSLAVQWNGNELETICQELRYYFRGIDLPDRGRVLLGQRPGIPDPTGEFGLNPWEHLFQKGVYEIEPQGACYVAGAAVPHPGAKSIYGFAKGAINQNMPNMTFSYTERDTILIEDADGRVCWESEKHQGGGVVSLDFPNREFGAGAVGRHYLPPRIHLADYDGDGNNDLIVQKNSDFGKRLLAKFRRYEKGSIECYSWKQDRMQLAWQAGPFAGYIGDCAVADINGDQRQDAVFSLIVATGAIFKTEHSLIMAITIEQNNLPKEVSNPKTLN